MTDKNLKIALDDACDQLRKAIRLNKVLDNQTTMKQRWIEFGLRGSVQYRTRKTKR